VTSLCLSKCSDNGEDSRRSPLPTVEVTDLLPDVCGDGERFQWEARSGSWKLAVELGADLTAGNFHALLRVFQETPDARSAI